MKINRFVSFMIMVMCVTGFSATDVLKKSIVNPNGWMMPREYNLRLISSYVIELDGKKIDVEKYDYVGGYEYFIINNRIVNGKLDLKEWEREWPQSVVKYKYKSKVFMYFVASVPEGVPLQVGMIRELERREMGIEGGLIGAMQTGHYLDRDNDGKFETLLSYPCWRSSMEENERMKCMNRFLEELIKLFNGNDIRQ